VGLLAFKLDWVFNAERSLQILLLGKSP
jgi:hypothetical protein